MRRYSALRGRPDPRSGQFIVIYIMGFFTMVMIAFVTLSIGQIMVRRQWAQLIADSGAFAGASRQAEGLNTISRINEFEFDLLNAVQTKDRITGYRVDDGWECVAAYFAMAYVSDIQDRHEDRIEPLFDAANLAVEGLNIAYRPLAQTSAESVTRANIQALFPNESLGSFNYPSAAPYVYPLAPKLTSLTPYFDETVAWWYWTTNPNPCYWGFCLGYICGLSALNCDVTGIAGTYSMPGSAHDQQPSPPESSYHFEEVLRVMEKDSETTFLWYVTVPAVPPVLGFREILGDLPPIVAVARAKPYGGTLGRGDGSNTKRDEFPNRDSVPFPTWAVLWSWDREPKQTYRAKLVPVLPLRLREDTAIVTELMTEFPSAPRDVKEFLGVAH